MVITSGGKVRDREFLNIFNKQFSTKYSDIYQIKLQNVNGVQIKQMVESLSLPSASACLNKISCDLCMFKGKSEWVHPCYGCKDNSNFKRLCSCGDCLASGT